VVSQGEQFVFDETVVKYGWRVEAVPEEPGLVLVAALLTLNPVLEVVPSPRKYVAALGAY
jgi:hypothetical protein